MGAYGHIFNKALRLKAAETDTSDRELHIIVVKVGHRRDVYK